MPTSLVAVTKNMRMRTKTTNYSYESVLPDSGPSRRGRSLARPLTKEEVIGESYEGGGLWIKLPQVGALLAQLSCKEGTVEDRSGRRERCGQGKFPL